MMRAAMAHDSKRLMTILFNWGIFFSYGQQQNVIANGEPRILWKLLNIDLISWYDW